VDEDDAIQEIIQGAVGENLVTHYIVILEVMSEEGVDLRVAASDNMTEWLATGMLKVAQDMLVPLDIEGED
jgi:hypothetical protein